MKKIYLTLFAMFLSFNANAFVVSPHVGLDYVSTTTNGFGTGLREDDFEKEVSVGGAIVFTLDVEDVDKY
jgi:hypothetical protein